MGKNTSFIVGDHFSAFMAEQVAAGRYGSSSEVVRAGLRLLEEREAEVGAVRAALIAGERSGPSVDLDFDDYIAGKRASAERD